jgi:hypothetical protein
MGMANKPTLEELAMKYPQIDAKDFILAKMAAKVQILEFILVDRLYPNPEAKQKAFDEFDADFLRVLETYLSMIAQSRSGVSGQSNGLGDQQN